jgi:hypothetical protein
MFVETVNIIKKMMQDTEQNKNKLIEFDFETLMDLKRKDRHEVILLRRVWIKNNLKNIKRQRKINQTARNYAENKKKEVETE